MTEATQVWGVCRKHLGPFGHLQRIENSTEKGVPDFNYCIMSCEGWVECKIGQREGIKPNSLTLDQVRWLERRAAAGGRAFLLVRVGRLWLLYDAPRTRALYQGLSPRGLFCVSGRFPLRELLAELAPPGERRTQRTPILDSEECPT